MATCSFDGSVKVWNLQTKKCLAKLRYDVKPEVTKKNDAISDYEQIFYSLAWSYANDDILINSTNQG